MGSRSEMHPAMADVLTEDQISDLKEAFSLADKEGKGSIRKEEISVAIRSYLTKHEYQFDFHEVMNDIEAGGQGNFGFAEFLATVGKNMKVKDVTDSELTSLYVLCRRWLRNDVPKNDQPTLQNFAKLLPKPLPSTLANGGTERNEKEAVLENYREDDIANLSEKDLLQNHIQHFKVVRKRLRDRQKQRIERYKIRLALLLQPGPYQDKVDT